MQILKPREKEEWALQEISPRIMRTGCRNVWDAIFWSFREYRELDTEARREKKIKEKTGIDVENPTRQMEQVMAAIQRDYAEVEKTTEMELFFNILNMRLLETELNPYLREIVAQSPDCTWKDLQKEWIEKAQLLAEYRFEKKMQKKGVVLNKADLEEVNNSIQEYLVSKCSSCTNSYSFDDIQRGCSNMEYNVIIISPSEEILFDSLTWKEESDSNFQDTILILAHPEGHYDSLGTFSYTKEGLQKITRIFSAENDIICHLRRHLMT